MEQQNQSRRKVSRSTVAQGAAHAEKGAAMSAETAPVSLLTPRERECLSWLASGLRNERIANRMHVSLATVEFHLSNVRRKLGASTREQALVMAIVRGLIDP